ncbi:MAG: hypothetical protein IJ468_14950 [Lachnospiraceae bacterium]|nr:hypothetical protein [Lachnospiraceae bacterium]
MEWAYEDVQIGERKLSEWKLMLREASIPQPSVKTNYVEIPGSDEPLDYTEAFGRVFYGNRTGVKMVFDYIGDYREFQNVVSRVANDIHGVRKKVVFGFDPLFYYLGRLTVDPDKTNEATGTITLTGTMEPYKYRRTVTVKTYTISEEITVTLENLRRPVVPIMTVTGEVTVNGLTLAAGTVQNPDIVLESGKNVFTLSGSGTIRFEYQEAGL